MPGGDFYADRQLFASEWQIPIERNLPEACIVEVATPAILEHKRTIGLEFRLQTVFGPLVFRNRRDRKVNLNRISCRCRAWGQNKADPQCYEQEIRLTCDLEQGSAPTADSRSLISAEEML